MLSVTFTIPDKIVIQKKKKKKKKKDKEKYIIKNEKSIADVYKYQ